MLNHQTVIAGLDFNSLTQVVLESATRVADLLSAKSLHLVHATQPWTWPQPIALDASLAEAWARIVALEQQKLEALPIPPVLAPVTRETLGGPATRELLGAAQARKAGLLVVATEGRGLLERAVAGSVAQGLLRSSPCPVLVAREGRPFVTPKHIVAAIDLSPISDEVLRHTWRFAKLSGAKVTVVSSYSFDRALASQKGTRAYEHFENLPRVYRNAVAERVHRVLEGDLHVRIEVVPIDPPSRAILESIERAQADLVVLGTSGHNAWERFMLGSTASRILTHAPCPMLAIPASMSVPREADHQGEPTSPILH